MALMAKFVYTCKKLGSTFFLALSVNRTGRTDNSNVTQAYSYMLNKLWNNGYCIIYTQMSGCFGIQCSVAPTRRQELEQVVYRV